MSSDNQYTALGPAAIGFQTDSTDIDTGVQAQGNVLGVDGHGPVGVRGTGDIGVQGVGEHGAGGSFSSSELRPQIHLKPQLMPTPPPPRAAQPDEFVKVRTLPRKAQAGDFWLAEHMVQQPGKPETRTCSLWLCVIGGDPAQWRQVLLGDQLIAGQVHPID